MESLSVFNRCIEEHRTALDSLSSMEEDVSRAAAILVEAVKNQKTILLAGNGGSASDAQHIAGEFVGRFLMERRGSSAIALGASDAGLTAVANDYGFDQVYARGVEAYGSHSGAFIAYSTSGNSPNILLAAEKARELGIPVIGMTGQSGGKLKALCDVCLCAPGSHTPRVQEMHALIGHILCEIVEPAIP